MSRRAALAAVLLLASCSAFAQSFGNGPELAAMGDFGDGKFQFRSVRSINWPQIAQEGRRYVERSEKVWVPATLYLPDKHAGKVPAMVIVHGIGGLYTRDGKKRAYWDYAELLAENGIAAVVIDTHGARGLGVASQTAQTEVSVYTFVADAFAAADMLRTHPAIDPTRIGIMGFSKGGATALLATDKRMVRALTASDSPFGLHIPIYPGCQVFPERPQPTNAPVRMLLGERDNFTGIAGCFEIEAKLAAAGVPVTVTVYPGAFHSWDEAFSAIRIDDKSSEDCRWQLRDGGEVAAPDGRLLRTAAEGQAYLRACLKTAEIYAGRNERANADGRRSVVKAAAETLGR